MHETIIANNLITEAKKQGNVKSVVIEVGEVAHLSKAELEPTLRSLVDWDMEINEIPAQCECGCGYNGVPFF